MEISPGCMACASPLRIFALRSSQACQVVQQWLALKLTIASPSPQPCAELYLRIAPATCAFALRLSRTYPRAESSTLTLLTSGHLRTALSYAATHCASMQLTFAPNPLTSKHMHTAFIKSAFTLCFTTYLRTDVTKSPLQCV